MPGFQTWPHHKVMNIEAPTSTSQDEEFIWRLPLSEQKPNSYITHFDSTGSWPQTNTVTVKYRFHYRYQMVQLGSDFVPVQFGEPAIFIDCRSAPLHQFKLGTENPLINLVTESNRPNILVQQIATGRLEDQEQCIMITLALTIVGSLSFIGLMFLKRNSSKIIV